MLNVGRTFYAVPPPPLIDFLFQRGMFAGPTGIPRHHIVQGLGHSRVLHNIINLAGSCCRRKSIPQTAAATTNGGNIVQGLGHSYYFLVIVPNNSRAGSRNRSRFPQTAATTTSTGMTRQSRRVAGDIVHGLGQRAASGRAVATTIFGRIVLMVEAGGGIGHGCILSILILSLSVVALFGIALEGFRKKFLAGFHVLLLEYPDKLFNFMELVHDIVRIVMMGTTTSYGSSSSGGSSSLLLWSRGAAGGMCLRVFGHGRRFDQGRSSVFGGCLFGWWRWIPRFRWRVVPAALFLVLAAAASLGSRFWDNVHIVLITIIVVVVVIIFVVVIFVPSPGIIHRDMPAAAVADNAVLVAAVVIIIVAVVAVMAATVTVVAPLMNIIPTTVVAPSRIHIIVLATAQTIMS